MKVKVPTIAVTSKKRNGFRYNVSHFDLFIGNRFKSVEEWPTGLEFAVMREDDKNYKKNYKTNYKK